MSNLQVLARRCPVMGKALAVQTAKTGRHGLAGTFGGSRAYSGIAKMHTTRINGANVASDIVRQAEHGMTALNPHE